MVIMKKSLKLKIMVRLLTNLKGKKGSKTLKTKALKRQVAPMLNPKRHQKQRKKAKKLRPLNPSLMLRPRKMPSPSKEKITHLLVYTLTIV
jgi:hypothetical protein